jgi:endonuclease/exonuclease/phosphatase family metal-dependent hydrolase
VIYSRPVSAGDVNLFHKKRVVVRRTLKNYFQRLSKANNRIRKFLLFSQIPSVRKWSQRIRAVIRPSLHIDIRHKIVRTHRLTSNCITVLSANLWHDWPFRRRLPERLESFARLVEAEGADVVLLQEVFRTAGLSADQWLADRLGMAYSYSRVNGDKAAIGFEEGLAIFSRFPLAEAQTRHLGMTSGVTRRLALASEVRSPLGKFLAVSVHLGLLRGPNRSQWVDLFNWVGDITRGRTAFIGGDFNTHESSEQIARAQRSWVDTFRSLNPEADGTTFEIRWPWGTPFFRRRFDYIFLRQGQSDWRVMDARHVESAELLHSDHTAVITRVKPHQSGETRT